MSIFAGSRMAVAKMIGRRIYIYKCVVDDGGARCVRVNFMPDLLSELIALKEHVWRDYPDEKVLGTPLHGPDQQVDSESDDIVKVCEKRCYYIPRTKQC
jgi:hypothetical protein